MLPRRGVLFRLWATSVLLPTLCASAESLESKHALTPARDELVVELEEVVVSATRTREAVGSVPMSPTILTRADIQRTPYHGGHQADDLLRYVPGVQPSNLSSRYNHPTAQAISLRGLGSRRALVLLDGVPLNDGFGGWINWGMVPDNIQRIEVVPGGGSNIYGTWAMGGVIHLLTQPVPVGKGLSLEGMVGNLDTYTTSVAGRYGLERIAIGLAHRWHHSNGFVTVPEEQRGPVDQKNDTRHQLFSGSLALAVTPRTSLRIAGNFFREDRSFGTPLSLATRTIGTATVGLTAETRRGDRWETRLFGQWQTFRNKTSQITPTPTLRLGEVRDRLQVIPSNDFGGLAQWTGELMPGQRLVIGGDTRAILAQSEEDIFSMGIPVGRSLARGKQVGWGLFGEWIAEPFDGLTVIPSFRADWWKNFDGRIESASGTVTAPRDNVETALNPKLALQYRVTDSLTAGASVYQAFRAPTLNELYRGFGFAGFTFLPNSSLSPERLWAVDAKLELSLLKEHRLSLRATAHYDRVKDQILFVPTGPLSTTRHNVGRTRTIGTELDVVFHPFEQLSLNIGYAYADSTLRRLPLTVSLEGNRIPNVSRHQIVVRIVLGRPGLIQLTVLGRYLSRQFADVLNVQPIADYVVLDASIQKTLGTYVRLFLNAENLTDRQYIATQTGSIKTLGTPLLVTGGIGLNY